jgi:hypothetical protein
VSFDNARDYVQSSSQSAEKAAVFICILPPAEAIFPGWFFFQAI